MSYETAMAGSRAFCGWRCRRATGDLAVSETAEVWEAIPEIAGAAMIREVHVYGPALGIGAESGGEAQHLGLGRRLIARGQGARRAQPASTGWR